jgi:hypothetical protein
MKAHLLLPSLKCYHHQLSHFPRIGRNLKLICARMEPAINQGALNAMQSTCWFNYLGFRTASALSYLSDKSGAQT